MAVVRRALFGCVVVLVACGALTALCTVAGLATSKARPIEMQELLVDATPFPEEWQRCIGPTQQPAHRHPERGASEFWFVGFCPRGSERFEQGIDGATHAVFRYGGGLEATAVFYVTFLTQDFSDRYTTSPWSVPAGWSYTSQVADRFRFACAEMEPFGLGRAVTKCRVAAQYDEYVSSFSTTLEPDYMTLQELEQILAMIDERMLLYLGQDLPQSQGS